MVFWLNYAQFLTLYIVWFMCLIVLLLCAFRVIYTVPKGKTYTQKSEGDKDNERQDKKPDRRNEKADNRS